MTRGIWPGVFDPGYLTRGIWPGVFDPGYLTRGIWPWGIWPGVFVSLQILSKCINYPTYPIIILDAKLYILPLMIPSKICMHKQLNCMHNSKKWMQYFMNILPMLTSGTFYYDYWHKILRQHFCVQLFVFFFNILL